MWKPIHIAVELNNYEIAEYLLQKGANPNSQALGRAMGDYPLNLVYDNPKLEKLLISHGASVEKREEQRKKKFIRFKPKVKTAFKEEGLDLVED